MASAEDGLQDRAIPAATHQLGGVMKAGTEGAAVSIPFVQQFLDEDRQVRANEVMETAAAAMLQELYRTAQALAPLRIHG
jgi:hypothetical protein